MRRLEHCGVFNPHANRVVYFEETAIVGGIVPPTGQPVALLAQNAANHAATRAWRKGETPAARNERGSVKVDVTIRNGLVERVAQHWQDDLAAL